MSSKGYIETDYGRIPIDWKITPSSKYCSRITDGTHDSPKQVVLGKPLVTSKHIRGRNIDFDTAYHISDKDYDNIIKRSRVEQWDVIISMIGEYCGFCYVERNSNIEYAVKNVGLFKTGSKIKAEWLYYFLQSKTGKNILEAEKSGTSQPYITLGSLRNIEIIEPEDSREQNAIVEVLSSLDDKIDLLHRNNKTLEQLAETLFRQWFVEEANESWEKTSLYDKINLVGGGTPKTSIEEYWDGGVNWLSGGDISQNHKNFIISSEKRITELGLNSSSAKMLPTYSTVITARGTVGKYCILTTPMAFSQSNYGVLPKINGCYFFTYLLVSYSIDELQNLAYGTVFDTITTNSFKEFELRLPTDDVIIDFEKTITPYFEKMCKNTLQIKQLEQLRDTLLPKLMSGEVRVQDIKTTIPA